MVRLANFKPKATSAVDLAKATAAVETAKAAILADPLISGDKSLLGVDFEMENEQDLVNRFVAAVADQAPFVISFGGSSVTAGHDNLHKDAYPQIMADFLGPAMQAAGSKLTVRNQAMGGTASTPWSLCLRNFLGDDTDIAVWEFSMIDAGNGGDGMHLKEYFLRNALSLSKQPAVLFVVADFPRRSEAKTKKDKTCRHTPPGDERDGCGVNMGLTKSTRKPGLRDGENSFTREIFEDYKGFGMHTEAMNRAIWDRDHAPPYDHWSLMMEGKPHGGGEWHPGLNGHRLRGLLLAWDYLQLLGKAIKALSADPAAAAAAAKISVTVKPLPVKARCAVAICGTAPHCASSFEPRVQGDLRDIMVAGGSWKVEMTEDSKSDTQKSEQRKSG
jgi:hypothetical protein